MAAGGEVSTRRITYIDKHQAEVDILIGELKREYKRIFEYDAKETERYSYYLNEIYKYGIKPVELVLDEGLESLLMRFRSDESVSKSKKLYLIPTHISVLVFSIAKIIQKGNKTIIYETVQNIVNEYMDSINHDLSSKRELILLKEFKRRWINHKEHYSKYIRRAFFVCQDNDDTVEDKKMSTNKEIKPTLEMMCFRQFKDMVYNNYRVRLFEAMNEEIMKERRGEMVDRGIINDIVDCINQMGSMMLLTKFNTFTELNIKNTEEYQIGFETPYIESMREYYLIQCEEHHADTVPGYLEWVREMIEKENQIISHYGTMETIKKVNDTLDEIMLKERQMSLLEREDSGFKVMLDREMNEEIGLMFRLFNRWEGGLEVMGKIYQSYIETLGRVIITNRIERLDREDGKKYDADDIDFIQAFITLYEKYQLLTETVFNNNHTFQFNFNMALKIIFNINAREDDIHPNVELLVKYIDMIMRGRRGEVKISEDEIGKEIRSCKGLFFYVNDKDYFQEYYLIYLARRLLHNKSHSRHMEREMISLLKSIQGGTFTMKFENMLLDYENPDSTVRDFRTSIGMDSKPIYDMNVRVLCSGFWPSVFTTSSLKLPVEMEREVDRYMEEHKVRCGDTKKIVFAHAEGTITLKIVFRDDESGWKIFVMMPLQAVIINLFNEREIISIKEMATLSGLSEDDVMKLIRPFFSPTCKLLIKTNNRGEKKMLETDELKINMSFTAPMKKIIVPSVIMKESTKSTISNDNQRAYVIDASVVRIMKSRRTFKFSDLIAETQKQIRLFNADLRMIRKQIEKLIENGYLERDETDMNLLKYLA